MPRKPTCLCGECERCKHRASVARWAAANPERNHAKARAWRKANPERVSATAVAWQRANPERTRAHKRVHSKVRRAIRAGLLTPEPCEICRCEADVHAHHDDYRKPLDVRWLCRSHHTLWHVDNEAILPTVETYRKWDEQARENRRAGVRLRVERQKKAAA